MLPSVSGPQQLPTTDPVEAEAKEARQTILSVELPLVPQEVNDRLADFFEATFVRTRLYYLLRSLWRHHSVRTANAMAFDLFLAMVPMLGITGWAVGLLLRDRDVYVENRSFASIAPGDLNQFIGQHFEALANSHLAPLAAIAGWWLSSSAFNTMIGVFAETFECQNPSWLRARLLSLGFSLLGMILLALLGTLGVLVAMAPTAIVDLVNLLRDSGLVKSALFLSAYLVMTSFLALIYRYSIQRPGRKRHVWIGSFVASFIGTLASVGLVYYATYIARYALFYGGLAAIVVVLLWLWLWSTAILIGAEINIAVEDVREVRGTIFPEKVSATEPVSADLNPQQQS